MTKLLIVNILLFQISVTMLGATILYFRHGKREEELKKANEKLERALDKQRQSSNGFYD